MHSVKNSIFASPQWAAALLLSLLAAAKLWFRGIGANIINQHLLTLSSPNHHLPSPQSNLAFLVMHFFVAYPSTAQRSLNSFTPGRVSGRLVHGWNFFFCKYLTLLHQGTPCEAWAGFVSAGGGSLTKTQDSRLPARLSHPKLCSLVAAREVSPWSQCNIKSFLPLLLLFIPSKTTQRAAQEQLDG